LTATTIRPDAIFAESRGHPADWSLLNWRERNQRRKIARRTKMIFGKNDKILDKISILA
jgi:hypothetical protein